MITLITIMTIICLNIALWKHPYFLQIQAPLPSDRGHSFLCRENELDEEIFKIFSKHIYNAVWVDS